MSASVNYSKENPQDPFVKKELTTEDHSRIMGLIERDLPTSFVKLAQEFCIPTGQIRTIEYKSNRNNDPWHGLNDVVDQWLRWNTDAFHDKVKANERWLYDAVKEIDGALATKIGKKLGILEPRDDGLAQNGEIRNNSHNNTFIRE
ncbi:PREDICTED: uncharacterized protein LOC109586437 [Amphimedon queenslandica]|uniref:Death domain-containing protein n=1 Tax=Amphimedon queenslandica TaxID=400682 RepID=A0AAN0JMZ2_AMPQE|nr:PREDICTED: uncharacterized protein LOC109586437 [Amphimedon queenslandica]|eukprot:XP_019858183.1 PREDICTED: uncharacterized protein LOC109586437 [Amphimedon queenslandica]